MRNYIFLVLDSLRWDIFKSAKLPFLRNLGVWKKAYTPGTYTFPAHMSFFVGKLPQTLDCTDYYDDIALRIDKKRGIRKKQLWRLANPEAERDSRLVLEGQNIIEGFKKQGYFTVGTGAVNWFNPRLPPGRYLTQNFNVFRFFEGPNFASHASAEEQVEWALDNTSKHKGQPYFLFINFGETHSRFVYKGCPWPFEENPYGDKRKCKIRQRACLEYLDKKIKLLLTELRDYDLVITSDHGEAMGEDGLWGHGFVHKRVMEVPILIRLQEER